MPRGTKLVSRTPEVYLTPKPTFFDEHAEMLPRTLVWSLHLKVSCYFPLRFKNG